MPEGGNVIFMAGDSTNSPDSEKPLESNGGASHARPQVLAWIAEKVASGAMAPSMARILVQLEQFKPPKIGDAAERHSVVAESALGLNEGVPPMPRTERSFFRTAYDYVKTAFNGIGDYSWEVDAKDEGQKASDLRAQGIADLMAGQFREGFALMWQATKEQGAKYGADIAHVASTAVYLKPGGTVANGVDVSEHSGAPVTPGHAVPKPAGRIPQ